MPKKIPPTTITPVDPSGKMLSFRTSTIVEALLEQYMAHQSALDLVRVERAEAARRMLRLGLVTWALDNPEKLHLSKEELAYIERIRDEARPKR